VSSTEVDHGVAELSGDPDRSRGYTLRIDGTAQSHVDLDDPTHLEFEYVRRLGHVADLAAPEHHPLRTLHLGGGAWTLARYLATTRPGSPQTVVELDGALVALVRERLPADGLDIDVLVSDARAALTRVAPGSTDLVVLDCFSGARTPAHLTSREFVAAVADVLAPGGIYAANVADGGALAFAGSQVAAARSLFPHVALIVAADVWNGRRFGNLVLVASGAELPLEELARRTAADPFRAGVLAGPRLRRFAAARTPSDRDATPSPMPPAGFFGRT